MASSVAAVGLVVVGTATSASAAPATACAVTGYVHLTDASTQAEVGWLSDTWTASGQYQSTTVLADRQQVSLSYGAQQLMTAAGGGPDSTYPLVGGTRAVLSSSTDLGPGNANFVYVTGTQSTAPGAIPAVGPNSFTAATSTAEATESAVWTLGADNSLSALWINSDGSSPVTVAATSQNGLVLTGDLAAFTSATPQALGLTMDLVPSGPADCTSVTSIRTTPTLATVGTTITATATVTSGGPTPTGSVAFFVCRLPDNITGCVSGGSSAGAAVPLTGSTASVQYTNDVPGWYCLRAEYSGDADTAASADGSFFGCSLLQKSAVPTQSFSPDSFAVGAASTLTITLDAGQNTVPIGGVHINDELPAGLALSPTASITTTCNLRPYADYSTNTVRVDSGSLDGGTVCTITVPVVGALAGTYTNSVTSSIIAWDDREYPSALTSTATVTVLPAPILPVSQLVETGDQNRNLALVGGSALALGLVLLIAGRAPNRHTRAR